MSGHMIRDKKSKELPLRFRNYLTLDKTSLSCNTLGLEKLPVLASAQFCMATFKRAIKDVEPSKLWVVDLRMESHWMIDGLPYAWIAHHNAANVGKSDAQIATDEKSKAELLKYQRKLTFHKRGHGGEPGYEKTIDCDVVQSERKALKAIGVHYQRFYVLDHHRPSDQTVQAFLEFYSHLPADAALYFHCRGGQGRATTFILMLDILQNAKQVSLQDMIDRHGIIGTKQLDNFNFAPGYEWKVEPATERLKFIKQFYKYVKSEACQAMDWISYVEMGQMLEESSSLLTSFDMAKTASAASQENEHLQVINQPLEEGNHQNNYTPKL